MKRIVFLLVGLAIAVIGFASLPTPHVAAQKANPDTSAEYQRALDEQTERGKRAAELLRTQEEFHKRAETLVGTQEQLLKRQEADFTRFEKILDTWERQQKQYQKYLDSLSK